MLEQGFFAKDVRINGEPAKSVQGSYEDTLDSLK